MYDKLNGVAEALVQPSRKRKESAKMKKDQPELIRAPRTFADFFCGIGGFHLAAASLGLECVFASDIDSDACNVYEHNFGMRPHGDIIGIRADTVPDHDVLFAGLPCQPFSIIGNRRGFADARGNLFLELARIIAAKHPQAVIIENVRQFATIDKGKPLACVKATLEAMGYTVDWQILNALNFGLPQKRERILIVATLWDSAIVWPNKDASMRPLDDLLEADPEARHFVSTRIRKARQDAHQAETSPMIWHENKAGNIASHPFSCALRAGASHNYLLVDGKRRLTPREMFRLQGFPDSYSMPSSDAAARRLTGNAVPVPMVRAVIRQVLAACAHGNKVKR